MTIRDDCLLLSSLHVLLLCTDHYLSSWFSLGSGTSLVSNSETPHPGLYYNYMYIELQFSKMPQLHYKSYM